MIELLKDDCEWLSSGRDLVLNLRQRQGHLASRVAASCNFQQMFDFGLGASVEEIEDAVSKTKALLDSSWLPRSLSDVGQKALAALDAVHQPWLDNRKRAQDELELRRRKAEMKEEQEKAELQTRLAQAAECINYILKKHAQSPNNPFWILGLPPNCASLEVLKTLKKHLMLLTHPDKIPDTPATSTLKQDATSAFRIALKAVEECSKLFKSDSDSVSSSVGLRKHARPMEPPPYTHLWASNTTPTAKRRTKNKENEDPRRKR